jgi:hypothetical protein
MEGFEPPHAPPPEPLSGREPIGRLSARPAAPGVEPPLAALGYLPGPHVLLRIDGLFPDDVAGRAAFREFVRWRLFRELARSPMPRPLARAPWPVWTLARCLRAGLDGDERGPPRHPAPEGPADERLGFFEIVDGREEWRPQEGPAFERVLERFLAGLRWPLPDVPGLERFMGPEDDGFGPRGHSMHYGLDLGTRLVDREGRFHVWPDGGPVHPLHEALSGRPVVGLFPVWDLEVAEGSHRLRLQLHAGHVEGVPGREGALRFSTLPLKTWGGGTFVTLDPWLRLIGAPKGNHVHANVRGLFEADPGRREHFMQHVVRPRWLAAPGPGAAAEVRPLPPPPPGESLEDREDPRGAAIARALVRLLTRRIGPLRPMGEGLSPARDGLPALDAAAPPWTLRFAVEGPEPLCPPFRGVPIEEDGAGLGQRIAVEAGGRRLEVELRLRGLALRHGALFCPDGALEIAVHGPIPLGAAWVRYLLAPKLLDE